MNGEESENKALNSEIAGLLLREGFKEQLITSLTLEILRKKYGPEGGEMAVRGLSEEVLRKEGPLPAGQRVSPLTKDYYDIFNALKSLADLSSEKILEVAAQFGAEGFGQDQIKESIQVTKDVFGS